jgi:hypothetical protein
MIPGMIRSAIHTRALATGHPTGHRLRTQAIRPRCRGSSPGGADEQVVDAHLLSDLGGETGQIGVPTVSQNFTLRCCAS